MSTRIPWPRVFAEGVVIVVSILLAFGIDAWWEGRQERAAEAALLAAVAEELDQNRERLDQRLAVQRRALDRIDHFVRATPDELARFSQDSARAWAVDFATPNTFDPDLTAAYILTQSTVPASDAGARARARVAQWLRSLNDAEEESAEVLRFGVSIFGRLADHAVREGGVTGGGSIFDMVGRMGPGALADLRSDDDFVSELVTKSQLQRAYVFELQRSSAVLDSVSATVRDQLNR